MYVFISHSSTDSEIANLICQDLELEDINCFFSSRDIKGGTVYAEEIVDGIDKSDVFLLLLSKKADQSPHVLREVERACSKKIPILVYKIEQFEISKAMEYFIMAHQWLEKKDDVDTSLIVDTLKQMGSKKQTGSKKNDESVKDSGEIKKPVKTKRIRSKEQKKSIALIILSVLLAWLLISCALLFIRLKDTSDANSLSQLTISGLNNDKQTLSAENTRLTSEVSELEKKISSLNDENAALKKQAEIYFSLDGNGLEMSGDAAFFASSTAETPDMFSSIETGDRVVFGNYNNEPIVWRVLHINDDDTAVLISDQILSMKPYDVAESGVYHYVNDTYFSTDMLKEATPEELIQAKGNNDWNKSNIRTWLNSSAEVVKYEDTAPIYCATTDYSNGYDSETGFLYDFSDFELSMMVPYDTGTGEKSSVFLLSEDELSWFDEAGMQILATPTESCFEQDGANYFSIFSESIGVDEFYWWLRTPDDVDTNCSVKIVRNTLTDPITTSAIASCSGYGIRPAICVKIK